MATLHETTVLTKRIGIGITAVIVGLLFLSFFFRGASAVKNFFFPPGPPPPTAGFGRLTKTTLPRSVTEEELVYSLDTISGVLPTFKPQLKVYKITHNDPSLLNLQRARTKVATVGFKNPERKRSDDVYSWNDGSELSRILTMNTISFNFDLKSSYTNFPPTINGENLPDESAATEIAKSYLESMELLSEDIDITKSVPELYTLKSGILTPATSLSTSQIIRVDFFQKDIDTIPMYYPHPPHSTINFMIGGAPNSATPVEANYFHQTIENRGETYPIKTIDEAFAELKGGKGYIASFFGTNRDVRITDVTLGYYLSDEQQDFLLPIFVFHGKDGFLAYVPAIVGSWMK